MIQVLKVALLVFASVVLQVALVARISVFGSRFDLPLALVVSTGLLKGSLYGELFGFISGLFCDFFSGGPLGIQSFSKAVIGYSSGLLKNRFYSDSIITQSLSGFIGTLGVKFIILIYFALLYDPGFFHIRIPGLILTAIFNSILVIFFFWILKKFIRRKA